MILALRKQSLQNVSVRSPLNLEILAVVSEKLADFRGDFVTLLIGYRFRLMRRFPLFDTLRKYQSIWPFAESFGLYKKAPIAVPIFEGKGPDIMYGDALINFRFPSLEENHFGAP